MVKRVVRNELRAAGGFLVSSPLLPLILSRCGPFQHQAFAFSLNGSIDVSFPRLLTECSQSARRAQLPFHPSVATGVRVPGEGGARVSPVISPRLHTAEHFPQSVYSTRGLRPAGR